MRQFCLFLLVISLLLTWQVVGHPTPVEAASITVNTTDDELNADGDCSLREAIQSANTNTAIDACSVGTHPDTIFVPSGVYTITRAGAQEDNNATGDFDIDGSLTIQGSSANRPTISGNHLDRVFDLVGGDIVFKNLIITHGNANIGGAILSSGYTLNLENVTLEGNTAQNGGAIYDYSVYVLSIRNSVIQNNTAVDNGGAIYFHGVNRLGVYDSTISNNQAGNQGGAIFSYSSSEDSDNRVTGSTFENNTARLGGALYLDWTYTDITSSRFIGNHASENGGAIFADASFVIQASCFVNNSATSLYYMDSSSRRDATGNWWGASNGPSGAGPGDGDSVGTGIDYSGFLTADNLQCGSHGSTPPTPDPDTPPTLNVPNLGLVMVHTTEAQPVYDSAGGGLVHIAGEELWIPHDADNSGYDTYIVTGYAIVDDEAWISIFLGNGQYVWIPLRLATPVTTLDIN